LNTWLTVDTDDLRHLPIYQGHPTRSKKSYFGGSDNLSETFRTGWSGFLKWMDSHDYGVTLFVITDLFDSKEFCELFEDFLTSFPGRATFGCHGHSHRSWSAWPKDNAGFSRMLETSIGILHEKAGAYYRPFFRAPSGYIAPWMAQVLSEQKIELDSSINPSWLTKRKSSSSWPQVQQAMDEQGILERAWLTSFGLPCNGPALFRFPLSFNSKRAWKKTPRPLLPNELDVVSQKKASIVTLYWHILDFSREKGKWNPPLPEMSTHV
jgi:peptidoglycan/xylan/chitin deacetylase (PgdA/CDA1 family)